MINIIYEKIVLRSEVLYKSLPRSDFGFLCAEVVFLLRVDFFVIMSSYIDRIGRCYAIVYLD